MPIYTYEHPNGLQRVEIVQSMNEPHVYFFNGVEWKRVFEVPEARIDALSDVDPFSKQQFKERTGKMKNITQGDLWDLSAELSNKRAKKVGKDPVKEKAQKEYEHRTGKPHPHAEATKSRFIE
jgi:hypothetical protein